MLTVTLDINDVTIATLTCRRISGALDGWCKYDCRYGEHQFRVSHYRPSGAPALVAAAMAMLAEAGVGRGDTIAAPFEVRTLQELHAANKAAAEEWRG